MSKCCDECKKEIVDCNLASREYSRGYNNGKIDAIDEYNAKIKECCSIVGSCDFEDLDKIAEQLKEKKND